MATAHICDRCGKIFKTNNMRRYSYTPCKINVLDWKNDGQERFDLCDDCFDLFFKFFEEKEREK